MKIKVKHVVYAIAFIAFTIIGIASFPKKEETIIISKIQSDSGDDEEYIFVHIDGEINEPGIKKVKKGTRIFELIEFAGGEKSSADLSKINLASILKDESKIIIPSTQIVLESNSSNVAKQSNKNISGLISINYASQEELQSLSGIGPSMAQKIISYREANGGFNTTEDIKNVEGIGDAKYEKIKNDITI